MPRLIDADALSLLVNKSNYFNRRDVLRLIGVQPTIQHDNTASIKTRGYQTSYDYKCSACEHGFDDEDYKFCPNCGARFEEAVLDGKWITVSDMRNETDKEDKG